MHTSARTRPWTSLSLASVCIAAFCGAQGCRIAHVSSVPAVSEAAAPSMPSPDAEAVRHALADAVAAFPRDAAAQVELAVFDAKTNAPDAAERGLLACWKAFPRYVRAPYQLGLLYLAHGRAVDALHCLQAAAAKSRDDAQVQWTAGLAFLQAGERDRAITYIKSAIAIDPRAAEPYLLLARCYDHPGAASQGIASLHKYLALAANPSPGYYLLGRLYSRQADRVHAEEWLRRAVDAEPNNPEFWVALGRVYYELSNASQAAQGIECYEKALSLDPNCESAHQYLGHALLDRHQYELAIPHLRAALHSGPDPGPRYYDLSQALLKAGHEDEGRQVLATYQAYHTFQSGVARLNRAIVAAPKDRVPRYALVRFCLDNHQPTAAQSVLEEISRQFGPDAKLLRLREETSALRGQGAGALSPEMPSTGAGPSGASPLTGALPGRRAPAGAMDDPANGRTRHGD